MHSSSRGRPRGAPSLLPLCLLLACAHLHAAPPPQPPANLQGGPQDEQQVSGGEVNYMQQEPLRQRLPKEHDVGLHDAATDWAAGEPVTQHVSLGDTGHGPEEEITTHCKGKGKHYPTAHPRSCEGL